MSEITLKKFKHYGIWNDHKIEQWLSEMAQQGWHMKSVNLFNRYTFVKGESCQMSYQIDFININKPEEKTDYFGLFQDAGWQHVQSIVGWQFWRKPIAGKTGNEIFTDSESKMRKYRRVLGIIAIVYAPLVFSIPFLFGPMRNSSESISNPVQYVLLASVVLNLYYIIRLARRIVNVQNKRA